MRSILTALAVGMLAIAGLALTRIPALASTAAPPEGTVLVTCGWSADHLCAFDAVKGTDYLVRAFSGDDCEAGGEIDLVNPLGQVTVTMPLVGDCEASGYGMEFRAAYTATYHLRYTPGQDVPPDATADVVTDCRADAKTHCVLPLGGAPLASVHSIGGDTDWFRLPNLRRGKLYTITATGVDRYTKLWVVDAKGTILAKGQVHNGSTTGSVRFRLKANGTYYLDIPDSGFHRTLSMR